MKVSGLGWFGFILFIVPALKVYAIQRIGFLDTLFDIWGIISCLSLVLITVKIKKNVLIKYIISFVLIYLVSTWFHNPDQLIGAISETSRLLIVPFYMLLIKHEHSMVSFLVKLRKSFILLLFVDTFTGTVQIAGIRIFENNAITFLGLDNYAAFIISLIYHEIVDKFAVSVISTDYFWFDNFFRITLGKNKRTNNTKENRDFNYYPINYDSRIWHSKLF